MHAMRAPSARIGAFLIAAAFVSGACGGAAPATPAASAPTPTVDASPSAEPAASVSTSSSAPAPTGLPTFADDEPLLVFALRTDLGGGIFVMRPDGTGRQQLATDAAPGLYRSPAWSPDGRRVAFVEENAGKILIAHLDGSPTELLDACRERVCDDPAWSPDGTRIAFTVNESTEGVVAPSASSIMVVTLASGAVEPAVRLERPLLAQAARWSPDGEELVIQVDRMDDEADETGAAIATVPASGGEPRYLTEFDVFAGSPDWGWTSNEIVYDLSLAGLQRTPPDESVGWELFGIKPDGSGLRQITSLGGGARLLAPRWTPDGRTIVAKQYDHNAGGGRLVDPGTGAVTPWVTGLEEARPLVRPLPAP
jgi:Tol biopolymer transport system component